MSSFNNMKARVNFLGGDAEGRMRTGKLRTLQRALQNSYQAEIITTSDNHKFRCLINPDITKQDYDDKIISIPFQEFDLNATEEDKKERKDYIDTNLKSGDIFHWERTDSDWIVYLVYTAEEAYFRGEIRKCKYEIIADGRKIKCYVRGPVETALVWSNKSNISFNDMNYSLSMLVPATEENLDFFHRFAKLSLKGHTWKVAAIDDLSTDGIIEVLCEEDSDNKWDNLETIVEVTEIEDTSAITIDGSDSIGAKTQSTYTIVNLPVTVTSGTWSVDNSKITILNQDINSVTLFANTYKALKFNLIFSTGTENLVTKEISVKAF